MGIRTLWIVAMVLGLAGCEIAPSQSADEEAGVVDPPDASWSQSPDSDAGTLESWNGASVPFPDALFGL